MSGAFLIVHGHFYQPPRDNPWLGIVERQDSARPFHDWNERITAECYTPNAFARVLDAIVNPLVGRLDHYYMNEIEGLENPTSEVTAKWLFDRIKPALPELVAITFHETCDARCIYSGE